MTVTGAQLVPYSPTGGQLLTQKQRDDYLPPGAVELIRRGIADNTWLAYRRQWQKFQAWCARNGRTPIPVSENTAITYLHALSGMEPPPAPPTVWIWYSAVRFVHAMGDPPVPWECGKKLSLAIDGYTKDMLDAGWRPKRAPRAHPEFVARMADAVDRSTLTGLRDVSVLLVGFVTAARASHMAAYRLHDVTATPLGLDFYLARSKTDQKGGGRTFAVASNDEHPQYCPVRATRAWMDALAGEGFRDGALYRPLHKHHGLQLRGHGLSFRMTSAAISQIVQKYGKAAGLGDNFTCHSLRRGYATWLRELHVDPLTIAETFGWAPGSSSLLLYLEEAKRWQEDAPALVGKL